jgi:hypothetical protein
MLSFNAAVSVSTTSRRGEACFVGFLVKGTEGRDHYCFARRKKGVKEEAVSTATKKVVSSAKMNLSMPLPRT